jgi:CBS domain-containing protein
MQDQPSLVTISPDATLQEAVARMIENDFSQLPVVEGGLPFGSPATFITSTSIARALRVFGTSLQHLRVRDALVPARTLSADEDLFSKMDDLLDAYAVLVLKPDGTIAGIVTNYDTTQYFRSRAEEMLLVEDVETTLKDHIRIAYGGDETDPDGPLQTAIDTLGGPMHSVRDKCRKSFRKFCGKRGVAVTEEEVVEYVDAKFDSATGERRFDDLSLSDYIQLALRSEAWVVLGPVFGVPGEAFREMLEGVRKTRNKLMHFRPDITAVERDQLRFCAEWFKNHPPVVLVDEPDPAAGGTLEPDQPAPSGEAEADPTEYIEDSVQDDAGDSAQDAVLEEKYARLGQHLSQIPRGQERISVTFSEVEEIIGSPLPATAREHRSWWANNAATHPHSEQWLKASWRVVSINMGLQRVIFARSLGRSSVG